ncbi:MAG: hypothetical protein MH204_08110 [Fimbriimonadaceae bacterium]|nr:hypothetical protein [Fimbriimonadaceae bacterium]
MDQRVREAIQKGGSALIRGEIVTTIQRAEELLGGPKPEPMQAPATKTEPATNPEAPKAPAAETKPDPKSGKGAK